MLPEINECTTSCSIVLPIVETVTFSSSRQSENGYWTIIKLIWLESTIYIIDVKGSLVGFSFIIATSLFSITLFSTVSIISCKPMTS